MTGDRRIDWLTGGGIAAGALVLYALTLCRGPYWYDSAEYVTAAVTLGIPHPPGYPLYTLLAHVFTWLPVSPALAVNAMSAVFAAGAVALMYALVRELGGDRAGAGLAAALLATGKVFWSNAIVAEVYTPALAVLLAVIWLVLRGTRTGRARWVLSAALLAGLGLGVHLSIATCGLGLALLVAGHGLSIERPHQLASLASRGSLRHRVAIAAAAGLAAAIGSCVFLYLPLRASMKPALNFGDPSTWDDFIWHITGGNYSAWFNAPEPFVERSLYILGLLDDQLSPVGLLLAVVGVVALAARRPLAALGFALMAAGNLWFFFDYGVHDVEVFFLPTTALLTACAGLGLTALVEQLRRRVPPAREPLYSRALRVAALALPALMMVGSYPNIDMSSFDDAEAYGTMMVKELPANTVIADFTSPPEWKLHAVFGYYYRLVRQERPDVNVVTRPKPRQLAALVNSGRPVYLYFPLDMIRDGSFIVEHEPSDLHADDPACAELDPETELPLPHCARWRISGLRPRRSPMPGGGLPPAGPPAGASPAVAAPPQAPAQSP